MPRRTDRYSYEEIREMVRQKTQPSERKWARAHNVNSAHLNEFMNGKRGPGSDLLEALGLEYAIVWMDCHAYVPETTLREAVDVMRDVAERSMFSSKDRIVQHIRAFLTKLEQKR